MCIQGRSSYSINSAKKNSSWACLQADPIQKIPHWSFPPFPGGSASSQIKRQHHGDGKSYETGQRLVLLVLNLYGRRQTETLGFRKQTNCLLADYQTLLHSLVETDPSPPHCCATNIRKHWKGGEGGAEGQFGRVLICIHETWVPTPAFGNLTYRHIYTSNPSICYMVNSWPAWDTPDPTSIKTFFWSTKKTLQETTQPTTICTTVSWVLR